MILEKDQQINPAFIFDINLYFLLKSI